MEIYKGKTERNSLIFFFDPMDCGPPGSSVHGISQARILDWTAISLSREISNFWSKFFIRENTLRDQ